MQPLDDIALRVTRLEASNRRLRLMAFAPTAVLAVLLMLSMQQQPVPEEIRAKKIVAERIVVEGGGPQLVLIDGSGVTLVNKRPPIPGPDWETRIRGGSITCAAGPADVSAVPGLLVVKRGPYQAMLSTNTENESRLVLCGPVPGAKSEDDTQIKIGLNYSAKQGSLIQIRDSMDRVRVNLGAQGFKTDGVHREYPESKFTLWNESGECFFSIPR